MKADFYCLKCKTRHKDLEVKSKQPRKGITFLFSECPVHGHKVSTIASRK